MKQPFTFPTYGSWCKLHGFVLEQDWIGEKLSQDRKKMYALLYLLALRDWVNEGWEPEKSRAGHCAVYKHFSIISNFEFQGQDKTNEFLSHKDEHTSAIEQLNILYDISTTL